MFRYGDYEKVKQDVGEDNWKAMRLYSAVALVAFGVMTLVSVFSPSIGKYKWVEGNEPMISVFSDRIEILSRGTLAPAQTS